jgi:hypothetical protein
MLLAISAVVASAAVEDSLETPQYTVVHAESDFEIRLYRPSTWVSTPVDDISFGKATQIGFHKNSALCWAILLLCILHPILRAE